MLDSFLTRIIPINFQSRPVIALKWLRLYKRSTNFNEISSVDRLNTVLHNELLVKLKTQSFPELYSLKAK